MTFEITHWLPLIATLIAGIFALSQIRANNITNARIRWLENLKNLVTDFLAESKTLQLKRGVNKGILNRGVGEKMPEAVTQSLNKINESVFDHLKLIEAKHDLIKLNLNPKETLHLKLEELLDAYMLYFNQIPAIEKSEDYDALLRKLDAYSDTLILMIRFIMKLEWEKTKRSFISRNWYMEFGKGKLLLSEALNLQILPERKAGAIL